MTLRKSQWFTVNPPTAPGSKTTAVYNGVYQGVKDPIGQGQPGATYAVTIISAAKLDAENPPFTQEEGLDTER
jgi:hypothetical protein